jgi:hypothetical protein
MPRKTHFKKGKRGAKSRRLRSRSMNRSRSPSKSKSHKYRGGCENDSCSLSGSALPGASLWTSKGGCTISKDIYNHRTDGIFYSAVN